METFCVNLNIHYTIPQELWVKVKESLRKCQVGLVLKMDVQSGMEMVEKSLKVL